MAVPVIPLKALVRLSAAQLASLLSDYQACLSAIATTGQEYEIGGRKFRRADLYEVAAMIDAITYAQASQSGTVVTRTKARFR